MAYDTENLKQKAIEAIKEHRLFFIEDIVAFIPCSKPTFYEHFPKDSNDLNELKELLYENKIKIKSSMRSKWYKSNNATLQMGLMKLIGTKEERNRLSNYKQPGSDKLEEYHEKLKDALQPLPEAETSD